MRLRKKLKGARIFLGPFEIKKKVIFLVVIVVDKSCNIIRYRAMQYLQNELQTSILCQKELDFYAFEMCISPKNRHFFVFLHGHISIYVSF